MSVKPTDRVLIPDGQWTPFANRVFTDELRMLQQKKAAAVYLFLIDHAFHQDSHRLVMSRAEIAGETGIDERVVKKCLQELRTNGLIELERRGVLHSQVRKDCWRVPAAERQALREGWTPVPRLLIKEYLPRYDNAVLLPLLLFHQHMHWRQECWVGVVKLCKLLNWSPTRVRHALRTMSGGSSWDRQHTFLPLPLLRRQAIAMKSRKGVSGRAARRHSVRAVKYSSEPNESKRTVTISDEFAHYFQIKLPKASRSSVQHFRFSE